MGGPKAGVTLAGALLIEYPVRALRAAGLDTVVVAKRARPVPVLDSAAVWHEPDDPTHPLTGIVEALARAQRPVVVCGCDVPFVAPALLRHLAALDAPLAVIGHGGRLHPLIARYEPGLLEPLRAALTARRPLHEVVQELGARILGDRELEMYGDPERLVFNVNTRHDLARAEALLKVED
jgi:molybdopterin-guanine dinucleotide biosynthesis protein A